MVGTPLRDHAREQAGAMSMSPLQDEWTLLQAQHEQYERGALLRWRQG